MTEQKTSWWTGLKAEFKKITWPTKSDLSKQTLSVVIASVVIGCAVALMDFVIRIGVEHLVKFPG
ncbi:MAG: preprotein translocase subunit SecE [Eubacteriales bacterium]|nr:preprotein translocase subunit SecE [Eubacteriales bacterium]